MLLNAYLSTLLMFLFLLFFLYCAYHPKVVDPRSLGEKGFQQEPAPRRQYLQFPPEPLSQQSVNSSNLQRSANLPRVFIEFLTYPRANTWLKYRREGPSAILDGDGTRSYHTAIPSSAASNLATLANSSEWAAIEMPRTKQAFAESLSTNEMTSRFWSKESHVVKATGTASSSAWPITCLRPAAFQESTVTGATIPPKNRKAPEVQSRSTPPIVASASSAAASVKRITGRDLPNS